MGTYSSLQQQGHVRSYWPKPPIASLISAQRGAIAIILAVTFLVIIGLMALALDLSRLFNRKVDLQVVADVTAMAAAQSLTGTSAGIDAARISAQSAASHQKYDYGSAALPWSDAAMQFSNSPTGGWMSGDAAKAKPGSIMFVRVDTAALSQEMGTVETFFLKHLNKNAPAIRIAEQAVAGRTIMNVTPLAICAISNTAAAPKLPSGELVEYGFRRGVGYDLMQLNPKSSAPANFVMNAFDSSTAPENTSASVVGPLVCAGKIPSVNLVGEKITVKQPFPLALLFEHLNSRFGQYTGGACDFRSAPPDANVKSFVYGANPSWMTKTPADQTAAPWKPPGKLLTVADADSLPAATAPAAYGQLWTYAKPVPFSAYLAGKPEPEAGYAPFPQSAWAALYSPGLPQPKPSYPPATPYQTFGPYFTAPPTLYGRPLRNRRVLNVPLLNCPVGNGSQATVLAIGKFFMTVPATATSVRAEFAGLASDNSLRGKVEFYK